MDKPKEKRKYYQWTKEDLTKALRDLKSHQLGLNECSRRYNISKPTLKRHMLKQNKFSNDSHVHKGRPTVFPNHIENQLAQHLLQLENSMFGLTISDVRRLAFQIAEQNSVQHNFNKNKQMAGKSWFYKFIRRHPELSLRRPESTSINRVRGFNKENVMDFYDKLEQIVDSKGITANTIFNVDETGVSTVQKKTQKIVGQKGKKQVGSISSGERGVNTTAVCAMSASGQYIPPMIIFKRKRMNPLLQNDAPPGSIVTVSDTGYINSDVFVSWLKHFINIVKPSPENNVLLLLDGHTTHSKNLEAIKLARENGVILLQLPGHTTHRLQPMDVSIFGPLSTYYIQAIETWMRANSGKAVTQYEVSTLFSAAYQRAATIGNAISGFKASGIWPVNRHVFEDHQFAAAEAFQKENDINEANIELVSSKDNDANNQSYTLNRVLDETNSVTSASDITYCSSRCESPSIIEDSTENVSLLLAKNIQFSRLFQPESLLTITKNYFNNVSATRQPTSLKTNELKSDYGKIQPDSKTKEETMNLKVPISTLSPIPKNKQISKRKKEVQKTIVLTSSPYKNDLTEAIQKRTGKTTKFNIEKPTKTISDTENYKPAKQIKTKGNVSKKSKTCKSGKFIQETVHSSEGASTSASKPRKVKVQQAKKNMAKKTTCSKNITKKRKRAESSESSEEVVILDDDSDDDFLEDCDDYCAICNGCYYDKKGPKVDWIQCVRCYKWLHDTCSENPDICPKCLK